MAKIEPLIPFIKHFEGGFINDPSDRGGATMQGITIKTYTLYCKMKNKPKPTVATLRRITNEEWTDILKTLFWDKWRADEIKSQPVANMLVDWLWNSGKWGIIIPQRILGVTADGIVGTRTISAINNADSVKLFDGLKQARLNFIQSIVRNNPTQKRFLNGWKRRVESITYQGLKNT